MSSAAHDAEGLVALVPPHLDHPVRLSDYLGAAGATVMIQRALNCVDSRLVDHGLRVGAIMDAMLEAAGWEPARRRDACLMALMHDIGAYRTEEIDRLVEFESCDVWEHSFYGYLFFKELSPLAGYAEVVLYHHMPDRLFTDQDPAVRFLAQVLQVADRVDMLLLERPRASTEEVAHALGSAPAGQFSFEATALFQEAERRAGLLGQLRGGFDAGDALRKVSAAADPDAAAAFLDMLVHVIDFRSRHTVTHTVTTAWTAYEIARRLMADEAERGRVYCAALLHGVGKIGIPLGILEKPGRLDAREMAVMRTHVTLTKSILAGCVPNDIAAAAARHHEKLDGSGYPRGLAAVDLKMADRIIAVADIVSALVGTRSYKEAFPKERVLEVLADQRDRGLIDGSCVAVMVRDYDEVMAVVQRACLPVAALYERVQQEYRWLLDQLARHEAGPLTEPVAPVG